MQILLFVELRILERGQPFDLVEQGGRKAGFRNVKPLGQDAVNRARDGLGDRNGSGFSGRRIQPGFGVKLVFCDIGDRQADHLPACGGLHGDPFYLLRRRIGVSDARKLHGSGNGFNASSRNTVYPDPPGSP